MSKKSEQNLTYVRGYLIEMSEIEMIETSSGVKRRATLTMETADGQVLFIEVRVKKYFDKIEEFGIDPDALVEVGFTFSGVRSFSKNFNNLYLKYMQVI